MSSQSYIPRWRAVALYRTANGSIDVEHFFDEIADLHDLIERGPHWDTLISCTITRNHLVRESLTLEEAETL